MDQVYFWTRRRGWLVCRWRSLPPGNPLLRHRRQLPGYTSYDLIAGYNSPRWSIAVRAVNVNDALYNIGSTGGGNIDISLPPHYQATFTFRF